MGWFFYVTRAVYRDQNAGFFGSQDLRGEKQSHMNPLYNIDSRAYACCTWCLQMEGTTRTSLITCEKKQEWRQERGLCAFEFIFKPLRNAMCNTQNMELKNKNT